jgi:hypothetical protein
VRLGLAVMNKAKSERERTGIKSPLTKIAGPAGGWWSCPSPQQDKTLFLSMWHCMGRCAKLSQVIARLYLALPDGITHSQSAWSSDPQFDRSEPFVLSRCYYALEIQRVAAISSVLSDRTPISTLTWYSLATSTVAGSPGFFMAQGKGRESEITVTLCVPSAIFWK